MAEPVPVADQEFTITRILDAPPEIVFACWTEPDRMTWWGPEGTTTPRDTISVDLRPGGFWRLTMVNDLTGERYPTEGIFTDVEVPHLLRFSWADQGHRPADAPLVTVRFEPYGDGQTELIFTLAMHDLPAEKIRELLAIGIRPGWEQTIDRLRTLLAT
ncbi:activator of HSP90 ATPase [Microlunatus endophyticus]|uniref:Activator of HSP90 ATPase n=1 Tax=Microlunatus endophyticus TaxID=1716077 RepID=A0A917S6W0_9ACTN|nr:SRPBCC domain-containing protein [Microlunatus endophyticus]GGL59263.1 activator of HSP90 ATPase [Microlunatus endophyticus]